MVDVNWHKNAIDNEEYRKVAIQVYTLPGKFEFENKIPKFNEIKDDEGMDLIKKAVANFANGVNKSKETRYTPKPFL